MKLLFEGNLAPRLVRELESLYPDATNVEQLGLLQSSDAEIWACAQREGYTIVSKDDDFQQLSVVEGHPPKVVLIRAGNCSTTQIMELLCRRHEDLEVFETDNAVSLMILR